MKRVLLFFVLILLLLPGTSYQKEFYSIGVSTLNLPIEQLIRYTPLSLYLNKKLNKHFSIKMFHSFKELKDMVKNGEIDFLYVNSVPYVYLEDYLSPLVIAVDKDNSPYFRGLIIVKANSPIKTVKDLVGKTIYTPSIYTAGGYWSQRVFLAKSGIDVAKDVNIKQVEFHLRERIPLDVYNGKADAGFIKKIALKMAYHRFNIPEKGLRILVETHPVPNWVFCANKDTVTPAVQKEVTKALLKLHGNDRPLLKIREIHQMDHFISFRPEYVEILRRYIKQK